MTPDSAEQLFLDALLGKTAADRDPARWNLPVIHADHRSMTKREVFNYYSNPRVRRALMSQFRDEPVMVVQQFQDGPALRRLKDAQTPIRIARDAGGVDDPDDFQYWIERRAVEFHPVIGERTPWTFVDLDPQPGFPWKDTKEIARQVHELMDDHPDVHSTEIRFSGGRGFYVIGRLGQPVHPDDARAIAKSVAGQAAEADPRLTLDQAGEGQLRLDTTTLKRQGSLRGLYSLNKTTGLASIPVELEHLASFSPEQATPESVIGRRLRDAKSLRP